MILYVGHLETTNFTFESYSDKSPTHACELLKAHWQEHASQTGAWLTWEELEDGVTVEAVNINTATTL